MAPATERAVPTEKCLRAYCVGAIQRRRERGPALDARLHFAPVFGGVHGANRVQESCRGMEVEGSEKERRSATQAVRLRACWGPVAVCGKHER
jgi:hypothetical protein